MSKRIPLNLESLDGRLMPAVCTWIAAADPQNPTLAFSGDQPTYWLNNNVPVNGDSIVTQVGTASFKLPTGVTSIHNLTTPNGWGQSIKSQEYTDFRITGTASIWDTALVADKGYLEIENGLFHHDNILFASGNALGAQQGRIGVTMTGAMTVKDTLTVNSSEYVINGNMTLMGGSSVVRAGGSQIGTLNGTLYSETAANKNATFGLQFTNNGSVHAVSPGGTLTFSVLQETMGGDIYVGSGATAAFTGLNLNLGSTNLSQYTLAYADVFLDAGGTLTTGGFAYPTTIALTTAGRATVNGKVDMSGTTLVVSHDEGQDVLDFQSEIWMSGCQISTTVNFDNNSAGQIEADKVHANYTNQVFVNTVGEPPLFNPMDPPTYVVVYTDTWIDGAFAPAPDGWGCGQDANEWWLILQQLGDAEFDDRDPGPRD